MADLMPPAKLDQFELKGTLEPLAGMKIHRYLHKGSGLQVFIVPQLGSESVALVTAYNVGSRYEVKGRTGLAHLFEHMMFRGTESFPEPFKTLSSWGDKFNAYTSFDLTLYHEVVPKDVFDDAARFESERMRKLLITREGFNTERGAVVSERKMRTEDSPGGRLFWELHQHAFDTHPYKTGPIGWQEDLDATTFEDALDFYNRYYAPNRATIAVVGDVTPKEALETLNKYYGKFTAQPWTEPKIEHEKPREGMRRVVIPMKAESVYLADSLLGITYEDKRVGVDSLVCSLLADSRLGYLSGELVEKGLARSVSGDCSPNVDPSLSTIFMVGNPGVSVAKLEKAYDAARKGFLKWVTPERVEAIKLYYLAGQYGALREPASLAEEIGRAAVTTGDPLYSFAMLEQVKSVTLADVKKRFAEWEASGRTRLILEPAEKSAPIARGAAK